jgi:hypothetical protein
VAYFIIRKRELGEIYFLQGNLVLWTGIKTEVKNVSIILLEIKIFLDLVLFLNILMKGLEILEQQGL